jgi:hypothetical protein
MLALIQSQLSGFLSEIVSEEGVCIGNQYHSVEIRLKELIREQIPDRNMNTNAISVSIGSRELR